MRYTMNSVVTPEGKPAIFLHGGPGGGAGKLSRRFFDPKKYRGSSFLIKEDCGKSKPHTCLEDNTTWHLVDDIEAIRKKLNIDKWFVFGGSMGQYTCS